MYRREALRLQQGNIPYSAIPAAGYLNILLDAEETGHKALGSQALRVHLNVTDGSRELAALRHGTDIRQLSKDREKAIIRRVA
jgi:hypothetical protein